MAILTSHLRAYALSGKTVCKEEANGTCSANENFCTNMVSVRHSLVEHSFDECFCLESLDIYYLIFIRIFAWLSPPHVSTKGARRR